MSEGVPVQWFPGHMAKTQRQIEKNIKLVDAVAEVTDARIPRSSRNPALDALAGSKPRLVLLNKADLADPAATRAWIARYRELGVGAIAVDCLTGKGLEQFLPLVRNVLGEKMRSWREKGMAGRRARIMVAGIPNSGKSTLINRLSGSSRAAAEDRPGVTRASQWFPVGAELEILDTPGILWPKFEDSAAGERLAFTGAVKDEVVDSEALACRLLEVLSGGYAEYLARRYKLEAADLAGLVGLELLERIGRKRGMLIAGGGVDAERAAVMVLDEFRAGKIGRITLEKAGE